MLNCSQCAFFGIGAFLFGWKLKARNCNSSRDLKLNCADIVAGTVVCPLSFKELCDLIEMPLTFRGDNLHSHSQHQIGTWSATGYFHPKKYISIECVNLVTCENIIIPDGILEKENHRHNDGDEWCSCSSRGCRGRTRPSLHHTVEIHRCTSIQTIIKHWRRHIHTQWGLVRLFVIG